MSNDALVLGAGVIGLTCAIRLQQAGLRVTIWAREPPLQTTSSVAPAIWYPYHVQPEDLALEWGKISLREFKRLAEDPNTGVLLRPIKVVFRQDTAPPAWSAFVPGFRNLPATELPTGYRAGFLAELPLVEMPIYLPYLQGVFLDAGGRLEMRDLHALNEAVSAGPDAIVNCTGLGARTLVGDTQLYPVRGQMLRVHDPQAKEAVFDPDGCTYVFPRSSDCILGGTAEEGRDALTPDPGTAKDIVRRCGDLGYLLGDKPRLSDLVGLRPGRRYVRLDVETLPGQRRLVHCYGHGGAGVTLSWGCAQEVCSHVTGT